MDHGSITDGINRAADHFQQLRAAKRGNQLAVRVCRHSFDRGVQSPFQIVSLLDRQVIVQYFGSFSTTREYALPFMAALAFGAIVALCVAHGLRAVLFAVMVVPYYVCAAIAARSSYEIAMAKFLNPVGQAELHYPLVQWVPHCVLESIGPVLGVGLTVAAVFLVVRALTRLSFRDGLFVFWVFLGLVAAGMLLACVVTIQRIARSSVPPYVLGFAFVLVGFKATRVTLTAGWRRLIYLYVLVGLVVSWGFMGYQLFVRFDGGGSYRHQAGHMEYYNHPFWLRPLRDRSDRHFD